MVILPFLILTNRWMSSSRNGRMADVKVEVAVVVLGGEGRGSGVLSVIRPALAAWSRPRTSRRLIIKQGVAAESA